MSQVVGLGMSFLKLAAEEREQNRLTPGGGIGCAKDKTERAICLPDIEGEGEIEDPGRTGSLGLI